MTFQSAPRGDGSARRTDSANSAAQESNDHSRRWRSSPGCKKRCITYISQGALVTGVPVANVSAPRWTPSSRLRARSTNALTSMACAQIDGLDCAKSRFWLTSGRFLKQCASSIMT